MSIFTDLNVGLNRLLHTHQEYQYLYYLNALRRLTQSRENARPDRTQVRTYSIFGDFQMTYNLKGQFPLLTTKNTVFRLVSSELQWFLSGNTNIRWLLQNKNHIWTEWPFQHWLTNTSQQERFPRYSPSWEEKKTEFENQILLDEDFSQRWGSIGKGYGYQFRHWPSVTTQNGKVIIGFVDQLQELVEGLIKDPFSRRHIISLWNAADIKSMLLPPCHTLTQFYVTEDGYLENKLYQRSGDWFLGVPFNIASYALLNYLVAKIVGLKPGRFIHTFGDAHLYSNHLLQAYLQLTRHPYPFPKLAINNNFGDLFRLNYRQDIDLLDYRRHPAISAPIAV